MAEGDWIRRRVYQECPGCGEYSDIGPGVLDEARTVETRTCPDCGTKVETEPLFVARPSDATVFNALD